MSAPKVTRRIIAALILFFGIGLQTGIACAQSSADVLIKHGQRPEGVVFEIVEGRESDLDWALEQIKEDAKALREKFPDLPIAVVSHGREQFALTTENQAQFGNIHTLGQALVDDDIPLHVCATHASWYDVAPEDFPDFIDVAPTGPGQIRQYEDIGYELIVVERRR